MVFKFPLPNTKDDWVVTQEYQRIDQGGTTNHYGIDWSNHKKGATLKAPIYAAADGVVCKACYGDDYGNGTKTDTAGYIVEINHGKDVDNFYYGTRYQHLDSATPLKVGDIVKTGDIVGYVGASGAATGAHLHFEILKYDSAITGFSGQRGNVNPRDYIYTESKPDVPEIKEGDIVNFTGTIHYASSTAVKGSACTKGKAKVTKIAKGAKHPYHLVGEKGGSSVWGWVDAKYVESLAQPVTKPVEKPIAKPKVYKEGDIVDFTGTKQYLSANASLALSCKSGKAKITKIYQLGKSKHPYHLVRVSGKGSTVWGWVNAADIK